MIESSQKRIDLVVHEMNHSGLPNLATMLANSLIENNVKTKLWVIGEQAEIPFPINENLEVKFLGIKRSKNVIGKILYITRVFFILSHHLAKERTRNVFMLGKEFIALAVIMKFLFPLRFKLGGFNDSNISLHINYNTPLLLQPLLIYFYKKTLKHSDYIVSQSEGMTHDLSTVYDIPKEKIRTIPPIINKKFFAPVHENKIKTNKILFIGKLAEYKCPFKIIEIFRKLENKNATLEFVGDGELEEALKVKVAKLGLQERILFYGKQDNTMPFLQKADVVVLASKYEGLPMVLVEAIACGVPIVSFDCPTGPSEIIIESVNGYLIPQNNIELFAQKLDQALKENWDSKRIAKTANKFHPDVVIRNYLEVIKKHLA